MTFSQRKNSSGSKKLLSYMQKVGTSNETLVLKDNMETDSNSSVDTNKSDEDNLLSMAEMGALLPSNESLNRCSIIKNEGSISTVNEVSSIKKYNTRHRKSISIDVQNIKRNYSDQGYNNNHASYSMTSSKPIQSASSNPVSPNSISSNTGKSNYKHTSYTNDITFNDHNSPSHSSLNNIQPYTVTNSTSQSSYHNNQSINNISTNNAIPSSQSSLNYNSNPSQNTVFSNSPINNSNLNNNSPVKSTHSLTNRMVHEPMEQNGEEEIPLNVATSKDENNRKSSLGQINDLENYRKVENEVDGIYNSTDMYSSTRTKNRKQKSFYKKLLNQGGENRHQIPIDEDYLDIKREDTQIIHDLFQKSICNNFSLKFKDAYTEICYNRYINNKYLSFWKKSTIVLALTILMAQMMILITGKNKFIVSKIAIFDIFGIVIPVIGFYYLVYRFKSRTLAKAIPYLVNVVLIFMGPVTLIGTKYFINDNVNIDVLYLVYISFFFVSHSLLYTYFVPSIISTTVFCVSWIFTVSFDGGSDVDWYGKTLKIILFLLISIIVVYSIYKKEKSSRRQFMNEQRLIRINSKLVSQLNRIERDFANEAADLDAPIEKAIITIRSLMASPTIGPEHLKALGMVLCYLQVPNLFAPDLDQQVTQGLKMDDERKKWLFNTVAHRKQIEQSKRSSSSDSSSETGSPSPFYTQSPSIHDPQNEYQIVNIDNYLTNHSAELLTKINDYNFPVFEYFKSTSRPLLTMSYHIFVKSGLLSRLHLPVNQFLNFMSAVEDGYHPEHQFHNAEHASDVLHCVYYFATIPNIATCFKDLDYLGMFVAACIHDFDHPGVSNKFLITVGDPLAELYNDKSVLENHHCSAALKLLNKPGNNFIERLDKEKKRELRETIIELVLATDLSGHFSYLTSFKKKLLDTLTCDTREDRLLLMQMLIKCCDVSNPTKSRNLYKEWIDRCLSEFFSQGDREKQLNIPVSAFCNRDNANVFSCQKGFIDFVAAPIFEAVADFINKYQVDKNTTSTTTTTQKQKISNINTNSTNSISRENSVQVTSNNDTSFVSHTSTGENEKQKRVSSSVADECTINASTSQRLSKTHHHKKTFSKINLFESQEKVKVIIDGLKSNKEWIDSNAAKTETSS